MWLLLESTGGGKTYLQEKNNEANIEKRKIGITQIKKPGWASRKTGIIECRSLVNDIAFFLKRFKRLGNTQKLISNKYLYRNNSSRSVLLKRFLVRMWLKHVPFTSRKATFCWVCSFSFYSQYLSSLSVKANKGNKHSDFDIINNIIVSVNSQAV